MASDILQPRSHMPLVSIYTATTNDHAVIFWAHVMDQFCVKIIMHALSPHYIRCEWLGQVSNHFFLWFQNYVFFSSFHLLINFSCPAKWINHFLFCISFPFGSPQSIEQLYSRFSLVIYFILSINSICFINPNLPVHPFPPLSHMVSIVFFSMSVSLFPLWK